MAGALESNSLPIRQKHDNIRPLRLRDASPLIACEPAQRATQRRAAAPADEETFHAHEQARGRERLGVGCLQPDIDVALDARENVRDEVIPDALDDVPNTRVLVVQRGRQRENATVLEFARANKREKHKWL